MSGFSGRDPNGLSLHEPGAKGDAGKTRAGLAIGGLGRGPPARAGGVFLASGGGRQGETTPPAPGWGNKKGEARKPRPNLRCRFA